MKAKMWNSCLIIVALMLLSTAVFRGDDATPNPAEPKMAEKGLAWEDFGIGGGGAFMRVSVDPSDPDTIYLGADCGGMYKTSDRGKHWRHINRGITKHIAHRFVEALTPDPRGNGIVYVCMDVGIFRSDDKGENWKWLNIPKGTYSRFACLEFDPGNPDVIYAGHGTIMGGYAKGIIIRSPDRGETWGMITNGLDPKACFYSICVDPFSPKENRTIYALSNLGIYRSTDNGASWQLHNGDLLPHTNFRRLALFADRKGKRLIFYLTSNRQWLEDKDGVKRLRGGVFRSDDAGATWREINNGLPETDNLIPFPIQISRKSADIAWVGLKSPADAVYGTTDGGKTWKHLFRMGQNVKVKGLAKFMLKHGWGQASEDIAINPRDERVLYAIDQGDIYGSSDAGETWEALSGDEIRPGWFKSRGIQPSFFDCIAISPHRPDVMLIGDDDLDVIKSEDGGVSWATRMQHARPGDELYDTKTKFGGGSQTAGCIVFDPDVPGAVYASGPTYDLDRVIGGGYKDISHGWCMKSVDFGDNWTAITPDNGLPLGTVWGNAIAIDRKSPKDRRTVYAAVYGSGIHRTDDSGMTWRPVNTGLPEGLRTTCVAVHPQDSNTLYCGVCPRKGDKELGGVYKSLDAGKTWIKVTGNPEIPCVYSLTVNPRNSNQIYAVNRPHDDPKTAQKYAPGLYQSDDGGKTWVLRIRMNRMRAVAVNPLFPEIAYAVAYSDGSGWNGEPVKETGGVFRTMDGGKTWKNINGDLTRVPLGPTSIALRPDDPSVIFIGLRGPGGYKAIDYEAREYMKKHQDKNVLLNGSFEELDADGVPSGWEMHAPVINGKKTIALVNDPVANGKSALRLDLTAFAPEESAKAAVTGGIYLTQTLSADQLSRIRGRNVRFSARVRFDKAPALITPLGHFPTFIFNFWSHGEGKILFETITPKFMGDTAPQSSPIMVWEIGSAAVPKDKIGTYHEISVCASVDPGIERGVLIAYLFYRLSTQPEMRNLSLAVDDLRLVVD